MTTSAASGTAAPDRSAIWTAADAHQRPIFSGHLHLTASTRPNGRTFLSRQSFRAPFHLSKPHDSGNGLHVQIVNSTAGMLAGDRLELDVGVEERAALTLTTPSAARAFMMRAGNAVCRQRFTVAEKGWLECSPEPLFCHRECDFTQETEVVLAPGAGLYFVDALAPGRAGSGEQWAWKQLVLALKLTIAGRPVLRERLAMSGDEMGRMAAFFGTPNAWFATVLIVAPDSRPDDSAWDRVRALHRSGTWCAVTQLQDGCWVVRIVAPGGIALRDSLGHLRDQLGDAMPHLRRNLRRV